ncbi:MAG: flagellar biosynthesis protein FlhA [Deltaproteobacteria bacterium]|nr:flagellar biosynthesis protein FlhA [Deltaproteobacteria bacterium]
MSTVATKNAPSLPSLPSLPMNSRVVAVIPFLLVAIVLLMVAPLPPFLLDMLLATSIALSVAILIISIHLEKPLDLSAFPTILLFVTLLRLALNVASTRLILMHGSEGTTAAGVVIGAFGEFMFGGNYFVGGAVFVLLVIINFVVITKGSSRVAEVAARFTLDAMPGKQMSIDADLAAGAITQEEARARRRQVEQESDFFGAMDGASKFVRGDAIAAVLMTGVNVVVGFVVGMLQQDMQPAEAASTYTVLAVGEGLASQIPALLVSTAAGVVITRASAGSALSGAIVQQMGGKHAALYATSAILAVVGLLPGMPAIPFFLLAGVIAFIARSSRAMGRPGAEKAAPDAEGTARHAPSERERLEEMLPVDLLELEVGYDLVPIVDASRGGELVERIGAIRKNLAVELGIIIPSVHIRDNLRLKAGGYRLLLSGNEIGHGELRVGRMLAMDPTGTAPSLGGEQVKEPAFGLPARWIAATDRDRAESLGYTVVDAVTVAATHLTEMMRLAAPELLGRAEAQDLVDMFAKREPRLVDELIPNLLPLGEVIKVLRNLLKESVSVRDLRSIFEGLADNAREVKDPTELTERVRHRLARHITARFRSDDGAVAALVLDPRAEELFRTGSQDATWVQRLVGSLDGAARAFAGVSTPPMLLCAPDVRRGVSEFFSRRVPGLSVLSYREVDPKTTVRNLGVVTA